MLKIAVFVSGGGTNLQSLIDATQSGSINGEIVLVVSNRKKAYGLERAKNAGIQAECIKDDQLLIQRLKEEGVELIVLAGYLAILSDELTELYQNRIINIHPSLIPAFCGPGFYGLHVHEHAFKRGVKVAGATVHFVSPVVDGESNIPSSFETSDFVKPLLRSTSEYSIVKTEILQRSGLWINYVKNR